MSYSAVGREKKGDDGRRGEGRGEEERAAREFVLCRRKNKEKSAPRG